MIQIQCMIFFFPLKMISVQQNADNNGAPFVVKHTLALLRLLYCAALLVPYRKLAWGMEGVFYETPLSNPFV